MGDSSSGSSAGQERLSRRAGAAGSSGTRVKVKEGEETKRQGDKERKVRPGRRPFLYFSRRAPGRAETLVR